MDFHDTRTRIAQYVVLIHRLPKPTNSIELEKGANSLTLHLFAKPEK